MASVQFSYPVLGDGQSQGFFTYSNPTTSKYVSFTPSSIAVANNKLYIKHKLTGFDSVWVIFNLIPNNKAKDLYYKPNQIKLNDLIMAEVISKNSTFLTGQIKYNYPTGKKYDFSSGIHVFEILKAINVDDIKSIGNVPDLTSASNNESFPLTNSSFASDELVECEESEVDTTPSTPIYKNTAINVGAVMFSAFVLMGCLMLIKKFRPGAISFDENIGLLKGFENNKVYLIVIGIFFIISFILFIVSGVSKDETKDYSSLFAYIFLVNTIIMMWFKVAVFIPDPPAAPAPAPA
jgi:hypothetical protein